MVNLPDDLYVDYGNLAGSSASNSVPANVIPPQPEIDMVKRWIQALHNQNKFISDLALEQLVSIRIKFPEISAALWDSHFTVAMMLQEIVRIYPFISRPAFPQLGMSHRVYSILLLFQCIAGDPVTKEKFLKAKLAHYVYPLMDMGYVDPRLEYLRLGGLGVIVHLLKDPVDVAAVRFVMDTGAFHFCAKAVDVGCAESKLAAVEIIEKILWTPDGLQYCCVLADRFFVIDGILKKLLVYISTMELDRTCTRMFHFVASCYARISQKSRARDGLRRYKPIMLLNGTFAALLAKDPMADDYRNQLCQNLGIRAMT